MNLWSTEKLSQHGDVHANRARPLIYVFVGGTSLLLMVRAFEQPGDVVFPSASVSQYVQAQRSFRDL